jgi:hypothetical protein
MTVTPLRARPVKPPRKALRITLLLCAAAAVSLGAALYGSASRGLNPLTAWACTSETRGGLGNVSGWDLEIAHTSCEILTKHEAISVYAAPYQAPGSRRRWFRKRILVFRYAPAAPDDLLPTFEATARDRILISIPAAESISVQNHLLGQTTVNYQIGRIDNPDPTGLGQAH